MGTTKEGGLVMLVRSLAIVHFALTFQDAEGYGNRFPIRTLTPNVRTPLRSSLMFLLITSDCSYHTEDQAALSIDY